MEEQPKGVVEGLRKQQQSCSKRLFTGHKDCVLCLDVLESTLASGSEDSTVRLWDLRTGRSNRCLNAFDGLPVTSVSFGKDTTNSLFYASAGTKVYCFDLRRPEVILKESLKQYSWATKSEEENEINQIAISPNGTFLAACDDAAEVKIFHLQREALYKTLRKHSNICYTVKFRGRNKPWEVFSGGLDSLLVQWDFSKGKPLHFHDMNSLEEREDNKQIVNPPFVFSIDISESGRLLTAGLGNGSVLVLDLISNTPVGVLKEQSSVPISQVRFPAFSPERHIVSGGDGDHIVLWDVGDISETIRARAENKKGKASQAKGKKGNTNTSDEQAPFSASVVLRIAHRSKLNWMSSSNVSGNSIFIADQSNDISVLDVVL